VAENRAYSMIGIARKAGMTASGGYAVEEAIHAGKAKLLIIAEDASDNTVKKFTDMAAFYHVRVIRFSNKTDLGRAVGTGSRSCIVIKDEGLAEAVKKQIERSVL
jgi:ribosomal protein L7Ae-like RNA K-turn-binding protein